MFFCNCSTLWRKLSMFPLNPHSVFLVARLFEISVGRPHFVVVLYSLEARGSFGGSQILRASDLYRRLRPWNHNLWSDTVFGRPSFVFVDCRFADVFKMNINMNKSPSQTCYASSRMLMLSTSKMNMIISKWMVSNWISLHARQVFKVSCSVRKNFISNLKIFKVLCSVRKNFSSDLKIIKQRTSKPSPANKHHGQFLARTQQSNHQREQQWAVPCSHPSIPLITSPKQTLTHRLPSSISGGRRLTPQATILNITDI